MPGLSVTNSHHGLIVIWIAGSIHRGQMAICLLNIPSLKQICMNRPIRRCRSVTIHIGQTRYHRLRYAKCKDWSVPPFNNTYWQNNMPSLLCSYMRWPINISSFKVSSMYWSMASPRTGMARGNRRRSAGVEPWRAKAVWRGFGGAVCCACYWGDPGMAIGVCHTWLFDLNKWSVQPTVAWRCERYRRYGYNCDWFCARYVVGSTAWL